MKLNSCEVNFATVFFYVSNIVSIFDSAIRLMGCQMKVLLFYIDNQQKINLIIPIFL